MRPLVLALIFVVAGASIAETGMAQTAPAPAPAPTEAPAKATPSGTLVRYAGQLLDVQRNFVFFTTGDAFRLAPDARIVDAATGATVTLGVTTRRFARATFDASGNIVELALAGKAFPAEATYGDPHQFAVAVSSPVPNPDLDPARPRFPGANGPVGRIALTGKVVQVRFFVRVPPTTRISDNVYLSNDVSGWNPIAIQMNRVDGLHYAVTLPLRTGTQFAYKYTRGSWRAAERGRTGIEENPRNFFLNATEVGEPDSEVRDDVVYSWSDDNAGGTAPITPDTIPTPFNPRPFGFPPPFPLPTRTVTPAPGPSRR